MTAICHCNRACRGFGWYDPVRRTPVIEACSIACMDTIKARGGNMDLISSERQAIENAIAPHLDDVQAFFDSKPSPADVLDYMAWAYAETCKALQAIYAAPLTEGDMPY